MKQGIFGEQPRRIGLALGGGGGRGSAHIGVISQLEQYAVPIDVIAGTSVGGLVGILYASGATPDEIEALFRAATMRRIFARDAQSHGLIGTAKIEAWLRQLLGEQTFADLRIPMAVVAVDLITGEEVVIDDGSLVEAILATIAVPGFFPPRLRGEQLLTDGVLCNNLPVDVAKQLGATKVIAVHLQEAQSVFSLQSLSPTSLFSPRRWLPLSQITVLDRSLDIMLAQLTQHRLKQHPPDVLLRPVMPSLTPFDITRSAEGRAAGAAVTVEAMDVLRDLAAWRVAPTEQVLQ